MQQINAPHELDWILVQGGGGTSPKRYLGTTWEVKCGCILGDMAERLL